MWHIRKHGTLHNTIVFSPNYYFKQNFCRQNQNSMNNCLADIEEFNSGELRDSRY